MRIIQSWIWRATNLTNIQFIQCTCNMSEKHAINLIVTQWITIMQWSWNRTKNHLIALSTFCRKMTNNNENLSEQISKKQLYRVWNWMKKSYDCTYNEFHNYKFSYDCNMQQISHRTKYKCQTTSKQIVEYIVLFLSRWFVCTINSWQNVSIWKTIVHFMSRNIDFSNSFLFRLCKRKSKKLRRFFRRMCKCNKMNRYANIKKFQ